MEQSGGSILDSRIEPPFTPALIQESSLPYGSPAHLLPRIQHHSYASRIEHPNPLILEHDCRISPLFDINPKPR